VYNFFTVDQTRNRSPLIQECRPTCVINCQTSDILFIKGALKVPQKIEIGETLKKGVTLLMNRLTTHSFARMARRSFLPILTAASALVAAPSIAFTATPAQRCFALLSENPQTPQPILQSQLNVSLQAETGSALTAEPTGFLEWGQSPALYGVSRAQVCARIRLKPSSDYQVVVRGRSYPLTDAGMIEISIPWHSPRRRVPVKIVDAFGEVIETTVTLVGTDPKTLIRIEDAYLASKANLSTGLGYTQAAYTETGARTNSYSASLLTLTADYQYPLGRRGTWTLQGSGYFSLTSLQQSNPDDARYLGLNARLIYRFPFSTERLDLRIAGGAYFLTMFVPTESFGFRNLSGPQLYPTLRLQFPGVAVFRTFFKYSPVSDRLSLMNLANNEIATGLSVASPSILKQRLSLNYNYAAVNLNLMGIDIQNISHSFSLSYSLL
jgi:hypothetical protein